MSEIHPFGSGSHAPLEDPNEMPPCYPIKGDDDAMTYHRPDSSSYGSSSVDVWFISPAYAEAAGFELATSHPTGSSSADFEPGTEGHPCSAQQIHDLGIEPLRYPYGSGSHVPFQDVNEMPQCYPIKGNVDSMLYHRPDSENYGATIAEVWFVTPSAAEASGFELSPTHPDNSSSADFELGGDGHPCTASQFAGLIEATGQAAGSTAIVAGAVSSGGAAAAAEAAELAAAEKSGAGAGAAAAAVAGAATAGAGVAAFADLGDDDETVARDTAAGIRETAKMTKADGAARAAETVKTTGAAGAAAVSSAATTSSGADGAGAGEATGSDSGGSGGNSGRGAGAADSGAADNRDILPFGPGSHAPFDDVHEMPSCHPIKGNADSMKYHRPDSQGYPNTKAEVWFVSPSAAEAAGFVLAGSHPEGSSSADYEPGGSGHPCSAAEVSGGGLPGGAAAVAGVAAAGIGAVAGAEVFDADETVVMPAARSEVFDADETVVMPAARSEVFDADETVVMPASGADPQPYGLGSHTPLADVHEMPACHPIKGNAGSMKYHRPDSQGYQQTKAEVWFVSPSVAEAAGFVMAGSHPEGSSSADFEPGASGHPCTADQLNGLGLGALGFAAAGVAAGAAAGAAGLVDGTVGSEVDADVAAESEADGGGSAKVVAAAAGAAVVAGAAALLGNDDADATVAEEKLAAEKVAADAKAAEEKLAAEKAAADAKAAEEKVAEEKVAADAKAAEDKLAAEKAAADAKVAEEKVAAEKAAADAKAAEEKAAADAKAAEEKAAADAKAAEEKLAAEKAAADAKVAEEKVAAEKAAADAKAAAEDDSNGGKGVAAAAAGAAAVAGAAALLGRDDDDDETARAGGDDDVTRPAGDARETIRTSGQGAHETIRDTVDGGIGKGAAAVGAVGAAGIAGAVAMSGAGKDAAADTAGEDSAAAAAGIAGAAAMSDTGAAAASGVAGNAGAAAGAAGAVGAAKLAGGRGGGGDDGDRGIAAAGGAGRFGWLKWLLPLLLLAALLALLLWACSGGSDGEDTVAAAPDPTAVPAAAEPEPTATAEPEPTATAEPEPTATAEPEPTATAEPEPTAVPAPSCASLVSTLQDNNFSTLLAVASAADVAEVLSDSGPLTLFAPTDEAFAAVPAEITAALLADTELLTKVLQYHVVAGAIASADLDTGSVQTLNGSSLAIRTDGATRLINASGLKVADLAADDCLVHGLNSVLVPPSLLTMLGVESLNAAVGGNPIMFTDGSAAFTDADSATMAAICNLVATEESSDGLPPVTWQSSGDADLDAQRAAAIEDALASCGPGGYAIDQLAPEPSFTG